MHPVPESEKISVRILLSVLYQHWYLFAVSVPICLSLAFWMMAKKPDIYEVKATMLLEDGKSQGSQQERFMKELGLFTSGSDLGDKIGILTSYTVVEAAVLRMGQGIAYYEDTWRKRRISPESIPLEIVIDSSHAQVVHMDIRVVWEGAETVRIVGEGEDVSLYDPLTYQTIDKLAAVEFDEKVSVGNWLELPMLKVMLKQKEGRSMASMADFMFQLQSLGSQVNGLRNSVEVLPVSKESNLVSIRASGDQVGLMRRFVDALMEVYIDHEIERKHQFGERALSFIDRQIMATVDSLRRIENELESFRSRSQIMDVTSASQALTQLMTELEREKFQQESQIQSYKDILRALKIEDGQIIAPSAMGIQDPLLENLLRNLAQLQQDRAGLLLTTTESNPQVQILSRKIESARSSLIENTSNLLSTAESNLRELNNRISQSEARLRQLPGSEKQLIKIQREFAFIDDVYKYLLEKRAEAGIAMANNSSLSFIVDKARQVGDGPTGPNRLLLYIVALVMGAGLPLGFLLVREFLNDKVVRQQDLEQKTQIPVAGTIVRHQEDFQRLSAATSHTPLAESFRAVGIFLRYQTGGQPQVIGITSHQPNEGKSFCAANLATVFALKGKATLLIDLDLRKPSLPEYFDFPSPYHLLGYLRGTQELTDIIQETDVPGLSFMPAGPPFHNPLDLLDGERFRELLETLRERYDYIVLDMPPVGITSDYFILKDLIDYTFFMVRHKFTSLRSIDFLNDLHRKNQLSDTGLLINMADDPGAYNYGTSRNYYGQDAYRPGSKGRKLPKLKLPALLRKPALPL